MGALVAVLVALAASALALLRWVSEDYAGLARLSPAASLSAWALALVHAALVASMAAAGALEVSAPMAAAVAAGALLAGAGTVLLARAVAAFASLEEVLGRANGSLVTRGPYALIRHPQALAWGLVLTGAGVAGRSAAALLLVVPYWALLLAYLPIEERHLRAVHGATYDAYERSVPRLWAWRRRGA